MILDVFGHYVIRSDDEVVILSFLGKDNHILCLGKIPALFCCFQMKIVIEMEFICHNLEIIFCIYTNVVT